jgi:hypothetical protein
MKKIASSLVLALLLFTTPIVGKAMHDTPPPTGGGSSPTGFSRHENATTNIASAVAVQILVLLVQTGVIP